MARPKASKVFVEVVQYGKKDRVVKRLGPMSERMADKTDDGLNINLNHEKFFTRIVPEGPDELGEPVS